MWYRWLWPIPGLTDAGVLGARGPRTRYFSEIPVGDANSLSSHIACIEVIEPLFDASVQK
jgi:hypothetical protein